jgi:hypothetical protein
VLQTPQPRSNGAALVLLGFFAGAVIEFALNLILDYTVKNPSLSTIDAISVVMGLAIGAVVGGLMLAGRSRSWGVVAAVAVSVFVAVTIADELALFVFFKLKHLPVGTELITGYFTHSRASLWIGDALSVALAAGLTAFRVARVRARQPGAAAAMPPQYWGQQPGQQWGTPPSGPYGPGPYGNTPPPGPYGPGPGPYGSGPWGGPSQPPPRT